MIYAPNSKDGSAAFRAWLQGRLIDHLRNTQSVGLEDLQALVLDEADRLLQMGFAEEVHQSFLRGPILSYKRVARSALQSHECASFLMMAWLCSCPNHQCSDSTPERHSSFLEAIPCGT